MEVVLTRLRDFSCKEARFEDYNAAVIFSEQPLTEETRRGERLNCDRAERLDIESALAWLKRELMEMRSQDQALIRQLMDLHAGIQELKQECAVEELEEVKLDEYGEQSWDSDSESDMSSYSGEISFYSSIYSNLYSPLAHPVSKRTFVRRSSVP